MEQGHSGASGPKPRWEVEGLGGIGLGASWAPGSAHWPAAVPAPGLVSFDPRGPRFGLVDAPLPAGLLFAGLGQAPRGDPSVEGKRPAIESHGTSYRCQLPVPETNAVTGAVTGARDQCE